MLTSIANKLVKFPLKRLEPRPNKAKTTAAVLVILHGDINNPQVVLTQRALHLNSHSGEVAFPGGMWDKTDSDLLQTALREAYEEVGLDCNSVEPVATLPTASPKRRDVHVTPYVVIAKGKLTLTPEPGEIAAIFDVPLRLFMDITQYQYFDMKIDNSDGGAVIRFPFIQYESYKIWGFTLKVITDMLNDTLGASIDLDYPTFEKVDELRKREKQ
jgi:8-oxo-dGTP pyrophosphatase MutT (NUDIX family)|tara:strand:- start:6085 stop:6729 length:645 start_codon:yes stop_codon:yes gene_type:complete